MNDKELTLLNHFIQKAIEKMGSQCCNDLDPALMKNWTVEEKLDLKKNYHDWNGDPEEYERESQYPNDFSDFAVFAFLWHKMKTDYKEGSK